MSVKSKTLDIRALAATYGIELPDCKDSCCLFGSGPGMRTQGGCRCNDKTPAVRLQRGLQGLLALIRKLEAARAEAKAELHTAAWAGG